MNRSLFLPAFVVSALTPAFCQEAPSFPAWLGSYPGVNTTVRSVGSIRRSSYPVAAKPAEIVAYYQAEFQGAGVGFQTRPDAIGTSIRATPPDCDLLIRISARPQGAFVDLTCSLKAGPPAVPVQQHLNTAEMMQRHQQKVAELGIHREHHDEPAPPLVWPPWLTNVNGASLRTVSGVDQSKDAMLRAQYTTNAPMTEIYSFYRELLSAHEYPTRSSLSTGHTEKGIQQNALGYVEGDNYPDGAPGARSEIHVAFDRSVLNGPITVTLRFTTHEYIASRGY